MYIIEIFLLVYCLNNQTLNIRHYYRYVHLNMYDAVNTKLALKINQYTRQYLIML